nr:ORF2 [Torque teno felis virus]
MTKSCTLCQEVNIVLLLAQRAGQSRTTAIRNTRRSGNRLVLARIRSGVVAVIGQVIYIRNHGLLVPALQLPTEETLEPMEE